MRFVLVMLFVAVFAGCGQPPQEHKRVKKEKSVREEKMREEFKLTESEKKMLLTLARSAIERALKLTDDDPTFFRRNIMEGQALIRRVVDEVTKDVKPTENLKRKLGVFVTLRTAGMEPGFCGCIGIFEPEVKLPLYKQVPDRALFAAFYDNRFWGFRDVTSEFLKKHIKIEISVLTPPRPAKIEDVVLGKHGIVVNYRGRSATYLPIVGEELKKEGKIKTGRDFVAHCVRHKAGLPLSVMNEPDFKLEVYEALRFEEE